MWSFLVRTHLNGKELPAFAKIEGAPAPSHSTALLNQTRGLLAEFGVLLAQLREAKSTIFRGC